MSWNSFGHLFRAISWGESHGPALGAVIDGCPPGVALSEADIQPFLDRRRPGQNRHMTQRREPDAVEILSGVHEGRTTGTPISLMIRNQDQRSRDYSEIAAKYRPGHADYAYDIKYGLRDPRGGGRSSARETAARVAVGAVARKVLADLAPGLAILGAMVQMGERRAEVWDDAEIERNPFWCPDAAVAALWADDLDAIRKSGSSIGAVVEIRARGAPAGIGAPLYAKLDQELASAMMSINAVKGVEIGAGFGAAALRGEDNADEMRSGPDGPVFASNQAGGVLGGIASGQDLVIRFAVKPTSSILTPRRTVTRDGENAEIVTKGRHDPCVGIRAVPVGEAMAAWVILDQLLLHRGQCGVG